jgi:hypothetical protein
MSTLTSERKILIDIPIASMQQVMMELALPFYGKVPSEKRWIRITKDDPPQITSISINKEGCDVYNWIYPEYADIQDYVPCTIEDWIHAKYAAASYCTNLKNK